MKISIVIPLYNKRNHIQNTIKSILSQSHSDFELIIIDDGSTDGSCDIVNSIHDERIKYIKQTNQGVSAARNNGILHSSTDYIAIIDADDEWNYNFLNEIATLINNYPEAGIWATAFYVQERNGEKYTLLYPNVPKDNQSGFIENYFESSMDYSPLCSSSVCISKKAIIAVGGFPINVVNGEDLDLWCRIALQFKIAYSSKPLATYRRDSEQMASRTLTTPCYFPFLYENILSNKSIIKDKSWIEKYKCSKSLEAVSASLFLIKNKLIAKQILNNILYPTYFLKKYLCFKLLTLTPQIIIDKLYKWRLKRIKNYDNSVNS